ncbi:MAG: Outer rane lipoprotein, partial [Verrucomicrobiota bacterium]
SAYFFLANEQRKQKKYAEANATLQSFISKNPKHELIGTARMAMAANLEALGKRDEALMTYQRIAADSPQAYTAPMALMSTVPLLKEKNQIEEARRVCETIITQYRESAVSMEATQQLRLLKGGNEPVKTAPPPPVATTLTPVINATAPASSPNPNAVKATVPPAAAPPAPGSSAAAASVTPKKP